MKLLLVFNCAGQDEGLSGSLSAVLSDYHWQPDTRFYGAFHKMENDGMLIGEAEKLIKREADAATFEAEWKMSSIYIP